MTPERDAERDAVVAWLRAQAYAKYDLGQMFALEEAADAIERGEHLKFGNDHPKARESLLGAQSDYASADHGAGAHSTQETGNV